MGVWKNLSVTLSLSALVTKTVVLVTKTLRPWRKS